MDKFERRIYNREWARRKRSGLVTSGIRPKKSKLSDADLKLHAKQRRDRHVRKEKILIDQLIGSTCCICDSSHSLISHRKDGTPHGESRTDKLRKDVIREPEKFARVCYSCHKGIHWCMRYLNMEWDSIFNYIKQHAPIAKFG